MFVAQDAGAYGDAVIGGAHFLARLLRSTVRVAPTECHVMPWPRGSLSDLKLVPLEQDLPPPGSVKVLGPSQLWLLITTRRSRWQIHWNIKTLHEICTWA